MHSRMVLPGVNGPYLVAAAIIPMSSKLKKPLVVGMEVWSQRLCFSLPKIVQDISKAVSLYTPDPILRVRKRVEGL